MGTFKDLTNQKFNRLTTIEKLYSADKGWMWKFRCDCGKEIERLGHMVAAGIIKSCGCLKEETQQKGRRTHGMSQTKTYETWSRMKTRCYNKKERDYACYGGRGITICDRWLNSFENFFEDMGECPEDYSIERKNVNGNYEPDNCEWLPMKDQGKNKRNSVWIEYNGEKKILSDWAKHFGIGASVLHGRLKHGYSFEEAINQVIQQRTDKYEYKGKQYTASELETLTGVKRQLITQRIRLGKTIEEAINTPVNSDIKGVYVQWEGKNWTIRELARHVGISHSTLNYRLRKRNMPVEEAIKVKD